MADSEHEHDRVTLGEVNRNVKVIADDVKELTAYVRAQNGRVSRLETDVAVIQAISPPAPNKRGVVVVGLSSAGLGAAATALLPMIKKALGF
jgi:hypothetical protein